MFKRTASIKNKYFCFNCYDQNWLIECGDGCGGILFRYSKYHKLKKFLKNHDKKFRDNSKYPKYDKHWNWKGGRYKNSDGYWELFLPDYFSSSKAGRVREHIYFYQEYYKVCVLKWAVVHHVDHNKENNMPWNLEGIMRSKHNTLHKKGKERRKRQTGNEFCSDPNCKNPTKTNFRRNCFEWYKDGKGGHLCNRCYGKKLNNRKKFTLT